MSTTVGSGPSGNLPCDVCAADKRMLGAQWTAAKCLQLHTDAAFVWSPSSRARAASAAATSLSVGLLPQAADAGSTSCASLASFAEGLSPCCGDLLCLPDIARLAPSNMRVVAAIPRPSSISWKGMRITRRKDFGQCFVSTPILKQLQARRIRPILGTRFCG